MRVCGDFRKFNEAQLGHDRFPIPNIREALESFLGKKIFGEMDLWEAYHQFMIDPECRELFYIYVERY